MLTFKMRKEDLPSCWHVKNRLLHTINALLSSSLNIEIDLQDKEGWSALMLATQTGSIMKARWLMKKGASLNLRNTEGLTALMVASKNGCSEIAEIMLNYGAEVDSVDNSGISSLMLASEYGFSTLVNMLLEHKAEVDLQDKGGTLLAGSWFTIQY